MNEQREWKTSADEILADLDDRCYPGDKLRQLAYDMAEAAAELLEPRREVVHLRQVLAARRAKP